MVDLVAEVADHFSKNEVFCALMEENVVEPVVDYYNQVSHVLKDANNDFNKALDERERTIGRYIASNKKDSKKVAELANSLDEYSELAVRSSVGYLETLEKFHEQKNRFFSAKVDGCINIMRNSIGSNGDKNLDVGFAFSEGKSVVDTRALRVSSVNPEYIPLIFQAKLKSEIVHVSTSESLGVEVQNFESLSRGVKCGYLWYRSRRTWSRKFMWIDPESKALYYLTSSNSVNSGSMLILLENCLFQEVENDERKFLFELSIPASNTSFLLQAESESEYKEWTIAISSIRKNSYKASHSLDNLTQNSNSFLTVSESKNRPISQSMNFLFPSQKPQTSGNKEVITGVLSIKDSKTIVGLYRDSSNDVWKSNRFALYDEGSLVQLKDGGLNSFEVINVSKLKDERNSIQKVHFSIFNRQNVFTIESPEKTLYFAAADKIKTDAWVNALKSVSSNWIVGKDEKEYRICKSLAIKVLEGRGFSSSADIYCELYIGRACMARTNSRKSKNGEPFWREDFNFVDLPNLSKGLSVHVFSQGKIHKDSEIGRALIPSGSLKPGEIENWYPVVASSVSSGSIYKPSSSHTTNLEHNGDLKLRIKFEEQKVLTLDQYRKYAKIFASIDSLAVFDLAQAASNLEWIAQLLLNIYHSQGLSVDWIKFLINDEVYSTENMFVLFRGNSLLTKALDCYMKMTCLEYLENTIGKALREICEQKVYCELDPTRLDKGEDTRNHYKKLHSYATMLWRRIESSTESIPKELRIIFNHLQKVVLQRFGQSERRFSQVRYTSVSGFIFLRLFCPAILNPKLFGITRDFPDPKTARTLTLLAKTMQCLANLSNFGIKEPFMIEMNSFIMDHSHQLTEFIDEISQLRKGEEKADYIVSLYHKMSIDVEMQYSQLHTFIRKNLEKLKLIADSHLKIGDLSSDKSSSNRSRAPSLGHFGKELSRDRLFADIFQNSKDSDNSSPPGSPGILPKSPVEIDLEKKKLRQRAKALKNLIQASQYVEELIVKK